MRTVKSAALGISLGLLSATTFASPIVIDFNDIDIPFGLASRFDGDLEASSGGCNFTANGTELTGVENGVDGPDNGTPHLYGSSINMECGSPFTLLSWEIGPNEFDTPFTYFLELNYQDGTSTTVRDYIDSLAFNLRSTNLGENLASATWYTNEYYNDQQFLYALDNISISNPDAPVTVPEPGTLALLGLGLLGLGAARRRG